LSAVLLDVNVLLALCEPRHVHAESAHRWFAQSNAPWATCPLTENAFIRIAANPRYPHSPGGPAVLRQFLVRMCASPRHVFWPDDVSLRDENVFGGLADVAPAQLTDLYLLGLAVRHGGRLATFDRRIPAHAIPGGADALLLIEG
jgi:uncharacterized protein